MSQQPRRDLPSLNHDIVLIVHNLLLGLAVLLIKTLNLLAVSWAIGLGLISYICLHPTSTLKAVISFWLGIAALGVSLFFFTLSWIFCCIHTRRIQRLDIVFPADWVSHLQQEMHPAERLWPVPPTSPTCITPDLSPSHSNGPPAYFSHFPAVGTRTGAATRIPHGPNEDCGGSYDGCAGCQ